MLVCEFSPGLGVLMKLRRGNGNYRAKCAEEAFYGRSGFLEFSGMVVSKRGNCF